MNLSTRRRLLKTGLASALVAASGVPVAARSRRGGCLRLAIDAHAAPLFGLATGCDHAFAHLATYAGVFETLVETAPDGMLRGELAEHWRGSPDARVWTIRLRENVRFHDGTPLTADHVALSLAAQRGSWALRHVASVEVIDHLSFQVDLSEPDTGFPFLLGRPEFAVISGAGGPIPQGTGPYRVTQYGMDDRLISERFEQSHNAGEASFDRIEVLASNAIGDRVQMLQSGRVDALAETAPFLLPRRFLMPDVQFERIKGARYLIFDLSQIARDGLRQRLLNSVDAKALVSDVLLGLGSPVIDGVSSGSGPSGPPVEIGAIKGRGFDETAARLVAGLARTSVQEGITIRAGNGAHGTVKVRWAESGEAQALLERDLPDQAVILSADAVGLASRRLQVPGQTSSRFPLDDARIARRWWMA